MNTKQSKSFRLLAPLAVLLVAVLLLALSIQATPVFSREPDPVDASADVAWVLANPMSVTVAGSLQIALGCVNNWDPPCDASKLAYNANSDVWKASWSVPSGTWEYKAALDNAWTENYGLHAVPGGDNIPLALTDTQTVTFYYDHKSHWVTDNKNSFMATAPGSFQSELGCPNDWAPECLRSWLQDIDGDGVYVLEATGIVAGSYEAKVALNENWDVNYGQGGAQGGANIPFTVGSPNDKLTIEWNSVSFVPTVTVEATFDPGLVQAPPQNPIQDQVFYFVMPDRFQNADTTNDMGGMTGVSLTHGFAPTHKGFFHGGDLAGLLQKMDYIEGMGVTAIWMTPMFKNRPVQGEGSSITAGYHGYWIEDFTQFDPHFGTNLELQQVITEAHNRGIKIFFDIITNHTADIIKYQENTYNYRNKTDYPYKDINGVEFDDRDYVDQPASAWPMLSPTVSFPYTPIFDTITDANIKVPAWLNNPLYYHNRGDSTFAGENSLYGDFYGLDDLFTEQPDVVDGMIDIYKTWVDYGVDGFRVDTVKHVNLEFWEKFGPAIMSHAQAVGNSEFFIFGEVFSADEMLLSEYTTDGQLPAVLDFRIRDAARGFASQSQPPTNLETFFANDDYFTDADSNAYSLLTFIDNHDIGRFGKFVMDDNPGAGDAEWVARSELGHALLFFVRGAPVIYYGSEQGFTGDGGDQDARQDMFPSQVASYNDDDLLGTDATTADDNFDVNHPIYKAFQTYADLYQNHKALRRGAQIHRYGAAAAGIYAFSRIDRDDQIEYLVAFNNAETEQQASFSTYQAGIIFTAIYTANSLTVPETINSDAEMQVTVTVPALSFVIYQAGQALPASAAAPAISINTLQNGQEIELEYQNLDGNELLDRIQVGVELDNDALAEVTFAVRPSGSPSYTVIGVDTNAPYRVFFDAGEWVTSETPLDFIAIVNDLNGHYNVATVTGIVPKLKPTSTSLYDHVILHYYRADGDYGDHTTGNYQDYWGLHFWGNGVGEGVDWTAPKPFYGEDEFGRFSWITLTDSSMDIGFIVHRGDTKDGTSADRYFNPNSDGPEIWLKGGDAAFYTSPAAAQGYVTVHYRRPDGLYYTSTTDYWGLHLWGDAIAVTESTNWDSPKPPTGIDDYGAYYHIVLQDINQPVNFIIHRGNDKDPGPDQAFAPTTSASVWIMSGDQIIYTQRGAAQDFVTLHYRRPAGDYGDYASTNYADFWGMHAWGHAPDPGWTTPHKPVVTDTFGVTFKLDLTVDDPTQMGYILHRGDTKDPGPDQNLEFATYGFEVWQLEAADPEKPYILPMLKTATGGGDLSKYKAYWVSEDTLAWNTDYNSNYDYTLYYAPEGGIVLDEGAITGGTGLVLSYDSAGLPAAVTDKFPHLAIYAAFKIAAADLPLVPDMLKGQLAIAASDPDNSNLVIDAAGLQIPGVLDDLYTYDGELGVIYAGVVPTLKLWAPTAKSVTLHVFDDAISTTTSVTYPMVYDADGVWTVTGDATWTGKFYLYEVEVYVHSTGQVEHNMVSDPYAVSLALNSTRSQIVNLADATLKPAGWDTYIKPELAAPEDSVLYELHVRDFSVNDASVPEAYRGTFKAFTVITSAGMTHLSDLADAGLTHLHLLPVFDIATINEDKSQWTEPDWTTLASYPPTSTEQQAAVNATRDADGFNWGYDPYHYSVPEGSYSTNPDGTTRIVEFREMVRALNDTGIRVVMDVVYNHTNASGQAEKSVLDKIVPGYYHRLDDKGVVATSTCCPNTATEHNMMEKLMIDSVVMWAKAYKVDGFRFDLMGHHMKSNMVNLRAALDALTMAADGVDGSAIYVYGEGWNFGEVQDGARGVNATQLNMAGTGIGSFNDRLRDAVRGGGPFDTGNSMVINQGFANGIYYDPNGMNSGSQSEKDELLLSADQIRVGLAGNLADYTFIGKDGVVITGASVDYNGAPAGYTQDPQENIIYISAHDNQALYDNNQYKMPLSASMDERVRAQNVGLSIVSLAQGVPFFHAGSDMLRSKSFDRDSYNSGDWFNKLDFTYESNNWGVGLPMEDKNSGDWDLIRERLADPDLKPGYTDIVSSVMHLQDMLAIRKSSPLFRLQTADEIQQRLTFQNTGPDQMPGLIVMSLSDPAGELDSTYGLIVVLFNANDEAQSFSLASLVGAGLELHPLQASGYDPVVKTASFDASTGTFHVPARTTAVFVDVRYAAAIEPGVGATMTYTDADGGAVIGVPAGVVTQAITLIYNPLDTATPPAGFMFAGHTFDLDAYLGDVLLPGFVFEQPLVITLHYTDGDVAGAPEDMLMLYTWDGSAWVDAACGDYVYNPAENWVSAPICHLSQFALFGVTYSAMLEPATDAMAGDPGELLTYTLYLTNTGGAVDTFDLTYAGNAWDVSLPTSVYTLEAGAGAEVVVLVTVPSDALAYDEDSVILTATSRADDTQSAASSLTSSANAIYGVLMTPPAAALAGNPGDLVTYTLHVTNTGNTQVTFMFGLTGNTWTVDSMANLPLAAYQAADVQVVVHVPAGALAGDSDSVTVTVSFVGSAWLPGDQSVLTTTANPVYGLTLVPPTAALSGGPGSVVAYTLRLTNTGNAQDTIGLTFAGNDWVVSVPVTQVVLAARAGTDVTVNVTVPVGVSDGMTDTVRVTATGTGGSDYSDLTTTAVVPPVYGVVLTPETAAQSDALGALVNYTLHLTNTGNVQDTYDLTFAGNGWVVSLPVTQVVLAANSGTDFTVRVTIPLTATDGESDSVTVTATSRGDNTKTDTSTLTTSASIGAEYSLTLAPATAAQAGYTGTRVEYSLVLTNTGNATDSFTVTFTGNAWTVTLADAQIELEPNEFAPVVVYVDIPYSAAHGATDAVTVRVTSHGDPTQSDSSVLTTTAQRRRIFLPMTMKSYLTP